GFAGAAGVRFGSAFCSTYPWARKRFCSTGSDVAASWPVLGFLNAFTGRFAFFCAIAVLQSKGAGCLGLGPAPRRAHPEGKDEGPGYRESGLALGVGGAAWFTDHRHHFARFGGVCGEADMLAVLVVVDLHAPVLVSLQDRPGG